jgi:hypothetical protein
LSKVIDAQDAAEPITGWLLAVEIVTTLDDVGTKPQLQLLVVFQSVLVVPVQVILLFVVKAAVLTLVTVLEQDVDENAIAVMFTTFAAPAVAKLDVVNVPVPGEPAVKVMLAVVEDTVFVPLTLYVTVYVPDCKVVEETVTVAPAPGQEVAAVALKLEVSGLGFTVIVFVAVRVAEGHSEVT